MIEQRSLTHQEIKRQLRHAEQLIERNQFDHAQKVIEQADLRNYSNLDAQEQGILSWVLGEMAEAKEKWKEAKQHFKKSIEQFESVSCIDPWIRALVSLGKLYSRMEDHEQALNILNRAYHHAISEKVSTPIEISVVFNLGMVHGKLGELYSSLYFLNRALELNQLIRSQYQAGQIFMALGICYMQLKRFQESKKNFENAIHVFRIADDLENQAGTLMNLGTLCGYFYKYEEAYNYLKQAIQIYQQIGRLELKYLTILKLAKLYFRDGEYQPARTYGKSLLIETNVPSYILQQANELLAEIEFHQKNFEQALKYIDQSYDFIQYSEGEGTHSLAIKKAKILHQLGKYHAASDLIFHLEK